MELGTETSMEGWKEQLDPKPMSPHGGKPPAKLHALPWVAQAAGVDVPLIIQPHHLPLGTAQGSVPINMPLTGSGNGGPGADAVPHHLGAGDAPQPPVVKQELLGGSEIFRVYFFPLKGCFSPSRTEECVLPPPPFHGTPFTLLLGQGRLQSDAGNTHPMA